MRFLFVFLLAAIISPGIVRAAYTVKNGKILSTEDLATLPVQEHYALAKSAMEKEDWVELIKQSRILLHNFSESPFAQDARFYLGVGYFQVGECDFANTHLSEYLQKQYTPKFFEEAVRYKFLIAKAFQNGTRKHIFGKESFPKWISGKREAMEIYDEVIVALPQNDLATESLFGKGEILFEEGEYQESIDVFRVLLRRFPKSPLARDAYVSIIRVYKTLAEKEYPDPDYLDLAEIHRKKFAADFGSDPKLIEADRLLADMKELYADDLYQTALFYERTKKPKASVIYYSKIVNKYPDTRIADLAKHRLCELPVENKDQAPPVPSVSSKYPPVLVDTSEPSGSDVQ